jgi:hypothetical protein
LKFSGGVVEEADIDTKYCGVSLYVNLGTDTLVKLTMLEIAGYKIVPVQVLTVFFMFR